MGSRGIELGQTIHCMGIEHDRVCLLGGRTSRGCGHHRLVRGKARAQSVTHTERAAQRTDLWSQDPGDGKACIGPAVLPQRRVVRGVQSVNMGISVWQTAPFSIRKAATGPISLFRPIVAQL